MVEEIQGRSLWLVTSILGMAVKSRLAPEVAAAAVVVMVKADGTSWFLDVRARCWRARSGRARASRGPLSLLEGFDAAPSGRPGWSSQGQTKTCWTGNGTRWARRSGDGRAATDGKKGWMGREGKVAQAPSTGGFDALTLGPGHASPHNVPNWFSLAAGRKKAGGRVVAGEASGYCC